MIGVATRAHKVTREQNFMICTYVTYLSQKNNYFLSVSKFATSFDIALNQIRFK